MVGVESRARGKDRGRGREDSELEAEGGWGVVSVASFQTLEVERRRTEPLLPPPLLEDEVRKADRQRGERVQISELLNSCAPV